MDTDCDKTLDTGCGESLDTVCNKSLDTGCDKVLYKKWSTSSHLDKNLGAYSINNSTDLEDTDDESADLEDTDDDSDNK